MDKKNTFEVEIKAKAEKKQKKFLNLNLSLNLLCCCLALSITSSALAATETPNATPSLLSKTLNAFSGYYKVLPAFSKSTTTKEGIYYVLQRLRLEYNPKITKNLELNVAYDHELYINDFSQTSDFDLVRQKDKKNLAWFNADQVISDTKHLYERQLLHRAFLKFQSPHSSVIFGKQLIDWGRMRFYSPLDIFNPPLPTDLETDERMGFDALNIELFGDNFTGLNMLYGPGRKENQTSFGFKFNKKIGTYDTTILVAKHESEKVAGFGLDGYLGNAGVRAEFTYTKVNKECWPRASIGVDYTFASKTTLVFEYFYNGGANGDYNSFSSSIIEARERLSLKKHLISSSLAHDLTPLLKMKLQGIYDIVGESAFLNPELSYNIKQNLDAKCGAQLFVQSYGSEFQDSQNIYYAELKYFF